MQFYLQTGDITRDVTVDAIVTLVNSSGAWFGGLDGAIQRVARGTYHDRVARILQDHGLTDGEVVTAYGNRRQHQGNFDHVIFVVDDLQQPLNGLVIAALEVAHEAGFQTIAFPMMRTGVMRGAVEPDARAVALQMRSAFDAFEAKYPDSQMKVIVVVYSDPSSARVIEETIRLQPADATE